MSAPQVIDLDQMHPKELEQLHQGMMAELEALTSNVGTLRLAYNKYKQSYESIESVKRAENGTTETLVPLTSSMYMVGKVANIKSVLVDVGTGYFAEKDLASSLEFFKSKMDMVSKNIETVENALVGKRNDLSKVRAALQHRLRVLGAQQA